MNLELKELIEKQDLSIDKLAEDISQIIIDEYGSHNYERFLEIVKSKLDKSKVDIDIIMQHG